MGVKISGFRLASKPDLPEMRKRLRGSSRTKEMVLDLNLTSMIDMFSVVILFLIQGFSATGEAIMINPALTLPQAYHGYALARAPIVSIMKDKVTVEGLQVGDNKNLTDKIEETDWELPLLQSRLQSYRDFVRNISPETPFKGEVIIQADANLDFLYIKRVLYTLTKVGFTDISLAVRGEATNTMGDALKPSSKLFKGAQERVKRAVRQFTREADEAAGAASESAEEVFDDISNEILGGEGDKEP